MRAAPSPLRASALIAVGAMTLHELRFVIAPPPAAVAAPGHAYVPIAGAVCAVALALAIAQLVRLVFRARRTGAGERKGRGFATLWLLSTGALLAIFATQELSEAALDPAASGMSVGLACAGSWVAGPLALALGALIALGLVAARAVVGAAARRPRGARPSRRSSPARPRLPRGHRPCRPSLATHLAGRAPPLRA